MSTRASPFCHFGNLSPQHCCHGWLADKQLCTWLSWRFIEYKIGSNHEIASCNFDIFVWAEAAPRSCPYFQIRSIYLLFIWYQAPYTGFWVRTATSVALGILVKRRCRTFLTAFLLPLSFTWTSFLTFQRWQRWFRRWLHQRHVARPRNGGTYRAPLYPVYNPVQPGGWPAKYFPIRTIGQTFSRRNTPSTAEVRCGTTSVM